MAKVKVLELSFIDNRMVEAGEVIEYDGEIGPNLELVDALDHDADGKKGGSKPNPLKN